MVPARPAALAFHLRSRHPTATSASSCFKCLNFFLLAFFFPIPAKLRRRCSSFFSSSSSWLRPLLQALQAKTCWNVPKASTCLSGCIRLRKWSMVARFWRFSAAARALHMPDGTHTRIVGFPHQWQCGSSCHRRFSWRLRRLEDFTGSRPLSEFFSYCVHIYWVEIMTVHPYVHSKKMTWLQSTMAMAIKMPRSLR